LNNRGAAPRLKYNTFNQTFAAAFISPPPREKEISMTGSFRLSSRFLRIATFAALFIGSTAQAAQALAIDVHRDANCGCCKKWIQHLEANGNRPASTLS
jgi:hypothetical protein